MKPLLNSNIGADITIHRDHRRIRNRAPIQNPKSRWEAAGAGQQFLAGVGSFSYDPNGMPTLPGPLGGSSSRGPWGFLYQGLENEVPDAPKLYWEPNGNIYNPDPFQITPQGPIGMGGGGGGFPHGPRSQSNQNANLVEDVADATSNVLSLLGYGIPVSGHINDFNFGFYIPLSPLDLLFGGGNTLEIPLYVIQHTQRGVHSIYPWQGIAADLLVTQRGFASLGNGGLESVGGQLGSPFSPLRAPDFYTVEVNAGGLVGGSVDVSIDRYGHVYVAPGVTVGKSLTLVSGSVTAGWLNQSSVPSAGQLHNFLTGHSFNAGVGFIAGVGGAYTPGEGTATQLGIFSPQIGGAYHYGFQLQ